MLGRVLFPVISAAVMTGCNKSSGPKVVEANYGNYNQAVGRVLREEMLLNVVRRRFFESPQFVAFGSISTSRSISANASGNVGGAESFPLNRGAGVAGASDVPQPAGGAVGIAAGAAQQMKEVLNSWGASGGGSVTDSPTFTIIPQQGPEIAARLHQQVDLKAFSQLTDAGYPVDLVLMLLAQDVSGLRGIDAGAGDSFRGGSTSYVEMLRSVGDLAKDDDLVITDVIWEEPYFEHPFAPENFTPEGIMGAAGAGNSYASLDEGKSYYVTSKTLSPALWISPKARNSSAGKRLIQTLGLDPDPVKRVWALKNIRVLQGADIEGKPEDPRDHLRVRTRSFYGILNLLAYGVETMPDDEAAFQTGKYQEAVAEGKAPDLSSQFTVHFSKSRPRSAFVSARYRGGWFYIEDRDRASKRVFNVLYDLYNLQVAPTSSGAGGSGSPILTLPVG